MKNVVKDLTLISYMLRYFSVNAEFMSMICNDDPWVVVHDVTVKENFLKIYMTILYHKMKLKAAGGIVHPVKTQEMNKFYDVLTQNPSE